MLNIKRSCLYSLVTFIFIFAIGSYYTYLKVTAERSELKRTMGDISNAQSSIIERRLRHSLSTTYILAQEVRRSNGEFKDFAQFAAEVMQTIGGVSNLQLAPNGITKAIYPLAGNEQTLGYNLLQLDNRKNEAWQSVKSKKLTLAGPFQLMQGGVGIIGRNPVFLEEKGEPYFWGFTIALIYLDELLASTELSHLQQNGYAFQLSRMHPDTGKKDVFAHSTTQLHALQVVKKISVPNGEWTITISREASFGTQIIIDMLLSFIIASAFTLFIRRMLLEPERLRALVEEQTLKLQALAFNDELTGIANRRSVTEQLDKAILHMHRNEQSIALMYLDLDDFKYVNDTAGHEVGDQLLIEVAKRLKSAVRETDIIGRLGGDEFAVILTHIDNTESVQKVAEKIISAIIKPMRLAKIEATVGMSIGIALAPQHGTNGDELLNHADLAMYQSKQAGKNKLTFYKSKA